MATRKAILIADDSAEDTLILMRAFLKAGLDVPLMVVKDGQQVLDYLNGEDGFGDRAMHPLPRLLLLDLKMPRMDGFDVLKWLQNQPELRRLVVTVLSSSAEPKDVNRAYDLGANSYVVKPASLDGYLNVAEKVRGYWLETNQPPDYAAEPRN